MKSIVVDDEASCRKSLQSFLDRYGCCDLFSDGNSALDAIQSALASSEPYQLLCLDIMLPGMDGPTLLRQIREAEQRRGIGGLDGIKIIMISSLDRPQAVLSAFRDGCEGYLVKPIDLAKLRRLVSTLKLPIALHEESQSAASSTASAAELSEDLRIFLQESHELLDAAEQELVRLEADPSNLEGIRAVFRSIHTIKGNSGFLSLSQLERLCHRGEALLDTVRSGTQSLTPALCSAFLQLVDAVRVQLGYIEKHAADSQDLGAEALQTVEQLLGTRNNHERK